MQDNGSTPPTIEEIRRYLTMTLALGTQESRDRVDAVLTTLLADNERLRAEVARLTAAITEQPYPVEVFTELSPDEQGAINAAIDLSGVRFARDRVYAVWARRVLAAVQARAEGSDA